MELNDFIKLFADQFEETPADQFAANTSFRDLKEWSSLAALSIIAMVDEEYEKQISGADIRSVKTIKELFNLVQSK